MIGAWRALHALPNPLSIAACPAVLPGCLAVLAGPEGSGPAGEGLAWRPGGLLGGDPGKSGARKVRGAAWEPPAGPYPAGRPMYRRWTGMVDPVLPPNLNH